MDPADATRLIGYVYWCRDQVLAAAGRVPAEALTSPTPVTSRDLLGTLVHELDVEWSWRLRLQGAPAADWGPDAELKPADFPTIAVLAERWRRDELEMRAWFSGLTVDELGASAAHEKPGAYPLSDFLLHIVMHASQQFRDAGVLLTQLDESPGDLEFLDYADAARPTKSSTTGE